MGGGYDCSAVADAPVCIVILVSSMVLATRQPVRQCDVTLLKQTQDFIFTHCLHLGNDEAFDLSGQLSDGWHLKQGTQRKIDPEGLSYPHNELSTHHRVSA